MNPDAASFLDDLRIASPCKASWDQMQGDDQVRFCGICQKNVYDVREMTRDAAERVIKSAGEACVRLARRADGTVITSDCPVGARDKAKRQRTVALVGGGLLAASALLWKVRADADPDPKAHHALRYAGDDVEIAVRGSVPVEPDVHVMMGDVSMPEPEKEPTPMMGAVAAPPEPVKPRPAPTQAPVVVPPAPKDRI